MKESTDMGYGQQEQVAVPFNFTLYFLTYKTKFIIFLVVHENSVRQLTRDVKSDARTLNFISDVTFAPP